MTYFIIHTADVVEGLLIRKANRDAHLKWLRSDPQVTVHVAGPCLDSEGVMRGSLLIVEAQTQERVQDWLETDPYKIAGLTANTMLQPYIWAIGAPT